MASQTVHGNALPKTSYDETTENLLTIVEAQKNGTVKIQKYYCHIIQKGKIFGVDVVCPADTNKSLAVLLQAAKELKKTSSANNNSVLIGKDGKKFDPKKNYTLKEISENWPNISCELKKETIEQIDLTSDTATDLVNDPCGTIKKFLNSYSSRKLYSNEIKERNAESLLYSSKSTLSDTNIDLRVDSFAEDNEIDSSNTTLSKDECIKKANKRANNSLNGESEMLERALYRGYLGTEVVGVIEMLKRRKTENDLNDHGKNTLKKIESCDEYRNLRTTEDYFEEFNLDSNNGSESRWKRDLKNEKLSDGTQLKDYI